ncbi:hypothetical protein DASB73_021600 [Starmerella bacillaris]|uniref:N-alpha-acetyltransferase 40 n=1 Tax=Starmerella bacillaris TaxID=1247836 RepID=A0AAV5RJL1_STABA|nr:hypothetical protein DASB73_021600 [Starmerella bacillaris]
MSVGLKLVHKVPQELTEDEVSQCYKLVRKLRPMYIASREPWDRKSKINEMIETEGMEFILLLTETGDVAAFVSFIEKDYLYDIPCVFIWELHVHPDFRRQGLATQLVYQVLERAGNGDTERTNKCADSNEIRDEQTLAQEENTGRVYLRSFRKNLLALQFYEALNFHEVEKLSDKYSVYMVHEP